MIHLSANISVPQSSLTNLFQNRDVQHAGWLRYIPFAEKRVSEDHRFWVVFALYTHDETRTPYLEFYQQRQIDFSDGPVSKHSLLNCHHISSVIQPFGSRENSNYEFVITLETYVIRLAADSESEMLDWIDCLKSKLISLNILCFVENIYSSSPTQRENQSITSFCSHSIQQPQESQELYETIFNLSRNFRNLNCSGFSNDEAPPPYTDISNKPRFSFRETQVEKLKKEMEQINGIALKVRKKDCYKSIALVNILHHGVYIAGWKQKDHPYLHNIFHVGDQLVSINDVVVESAFHANNVIKQSSQNLHLVVRRVPFGQVFCVKRHYEGQDLGLVRLKGTSEIGWIAPDSLAAKAGLLTKCTFYNDKDQSSNSPNHNWSLTEINFRNLNLFYKNDEIADRLNAIGKEISILVQPHAFVKKLKKQLKVMKNYKDFIVQ